MATQKSNPLIDTAARQQGELQSPEQVKHMNEPAVDPTGFNPGDEEFLNLVMGKIESGAINLFHPSTLLNTAVYEKLDDQARGKADLDAMGMLAKIRQIHSLWQFNKQPTFMIQNLILDVKHTKEHLEKLGGDIFII